ncbi:hypothetical protein H0H81_002820 [Sphagnurus paluster]|uniref:Uncharacterized protein n=1 Tax=Sphagnurus paluster TaxID=117069 RepID=A0A9P7KLR0_9AGAR|nr:hypothetical protein H0H81_002820 [Sphagnurus paluster]
MRTNILILGAGWTSTFLLPLCTDRGLSCTGTSRAGRAHTVPFVFDPESEDIEPYRVLPDADTVVITFPITVEGASERLVRCYRASRESAFRIGFVQLGTTGVWDGTRKTRGAAAAAAAANDTTASTAPPPPPQPIANKWYDRHTPLASSPRGTAETELLALNSPETPTTVLNLSGLWGGARSPRNWVKMVAPTKEALAAKGSVHMIHGIDVARAILAVHNDFAKAAGQRWILTDTRVYDWWDLASAWGVPAPPPQTAVPAVEGQVVLASENVKAKGEGEGERKEEEEEEARGPHARWVRELMREQGVRALPRDVGVLGRALDGREFWEVFGISPLKARLEQSLL